MRNLSSAGVHAVAATSETGEAIAADAAALTHVLLLFPSLPSYSLPDEGVARPIASRWRGLCHKCRVAFSLGSRRQIGATVYAIGGILARTFGGSRPV